MLIYFNFGTSFNTIISLSLITDFLSFKNILLVHCSTHKPHISYHTKLLFINQFKSISKS